MTLDPGVPAAPALDELPDGVVVAGRDGRVESVNRAAVRLLRRPVAELVGASLADALPLQDAQGRDWWACTDPWGGLDTRTRQPEVVLRLPDGRHLLVTATLVRDPDRALARLVVGLRDTAARDRAERERAELVSIMSHDLRSPLASIKGFTATMLRAWDRLDDEQKKHMLETVVHDADRMARLIGDLLDVSRIDAGRLELRRQPLDVPAVLSRTVAAHAAAHPDRELRAEVADGLPEVWADPDKLAQVLGNLLENGVRHGEGAVVVTARPHGDGVEVAVDDAGAGIPAGAEQRVFGKFWRSGDSRGTGLGLFIVKGIVEAHGGSVAVGRAAAGGARVAFTLPAGTPDHG